jgi:DNA polymerase V
VLGDSMRDANILSGDILVVDKALNAKSGSIIVAILNGEFVVKRLVVDGKKYMLVPENPSFKTIHINSDDDFEIWGIVTYVIHKAQ